MMKFPFFPELNSSISVSADSAPKRINSEMESARPKTEVLDPRESARAFTYEEKLLICADG